MKKGLLIGLTALGMVLNSSMSSAAVSGRVIDDAGKPVADAMINYTDLNNRLIYVYTDAEGRFAIPAPQEWNLKDLPMYKSQTAIIGESRQFAKLHPEARLNLVVAGGQIRFSVEKNSHVTVQLFNMSGRQIRNVFQGSLSSGSYSMDPFADSRELSAHQVYVVRVSDGAVSQSQRMLFMGGQAGARNAAHAAAPAAVKMAKAVKLTAVDNIRAGKTGYTAKQVAIESYSAAVGDIKLAKRDIEAEIDDLMAGKDKSWKSYQCVQGGDWTNNAKFGTAFYGASTNRSHTARAAEVQKWQDAAKGSGGAGVPQIIGIDAVHGLISPTAGTILPHNIGLGCMKKPELAELAQRVCAMECRAVGVNWAFAPDIDVVRNERHGRTYEGWDEGPEGTMICSRAAIRGLQGTDLSSPYVLAATAKHFAGAGGTANGTHTGNANTGDWETLCKIHLPGFKAACDAGVATIMAAFNQWLGVEMHVNKPLLTDTLKTRWGWNGFIVGDWDEAKNNGVANCMNAGLDNPMLAGEPMTAYNGIMQATDARINDACRRILRVKLWMNLLNDCNPKTEMIPHVLSEGHKAVARECVRRSLVLLKNDVTSGTTKALPLQAGDNIHVMGSWADDMYKQCGGWTHAWPSGDPIWTANVPPPPGTTLRQAIDAACTGKVTYANATTGIPSDADVIVVVVGEEPYAETGGDRLAEELALDKVNKKMASLNQATNHKALIDAAAASGKPVVVVLYTGRPLIISDELTKCKAFVCAWLPGTEAGGIADVLFAVNGENFTAKLSHTWPKTPTQIPINTGNYGDVTGSGGEPQFPYGYGLSY